MEALVSDILQSRKREPDGLKQTALLSLGAHAAVLAVLALLPAIMPEAGAAAAGRDEHQSGRHAWPAQRRHADARRAADRGGASRRPRRRSPEIRCPPRRSPPKMTLPDPRQKPRTPPKTTAPSKDPKGTTAGRGVEAQAGTARVETGAKGQGFGLSSGGGGGTGRRLDVDDDFCCPEYIMDMRNRIHKNWNQQQQAHGCRAHEIHHPAERADHRHRGGRPSGNPSLDIASQRALMNTRMLAPLPAAFPDPQLTVHLTFNYERR